MEKGIHKIGDMLFEEFNNLSYQEQCDYISTLKPIVVENLENQGKYEEASLKLAESKKLERSDIRRPVNYIGSQVFMYV